MSVFTRVIILHLFMDIIVITVFYSCFYYHCNIAFVSLNRGTATKTSFFRYSFHDIVALIFFVKTVWLLYVRFIRMAKIELMLVSINFVANT